MHTNPLLRRLATNGAKTLPVILVLLSGCAADVTSSANLASSNTSRFEENFSILPTELHGSVPGQSGTELAALYPMSASPEYQFFAETHMLTAPERVVLYVNGAHVPMDQALCSDPGMFSPGPQPGPRASVTAALCVGSSVISIARGSVLSLDQPTDDLRQGFGTIKDQLFDVLEPGPEPGENS